MLFVGLQNQQKDNKKTSLNLFQKLKQKNNFFVFSMMLFLIQKEIKKQQKNIS